MLRLYNTLSHQVEEFKPIKPSLVGLYSCGPTVYNYAHIGNLRAYVFVDLLKRYLQFSGYAVKHVMNITDVDDKTIKGSRAAAQNLKEYTSFYEQAFLNDLALLNIQLPTELPHASTHVPEMMELIKKLTANGYTYQASDGSIYFDISKFSGYGRLAELDRQKLKTNAAGRLSSADEYAKEDANDFVLWKAYTPTDGDVFWDSPFGKGRPGWHLECSTMSMKYLGPTFDIHTGGIDLVFPHHTNEIAQSEAATGQPFVNYWLHNEFLNLSGEKVSKSLGNVIYLKDLIEKGYHPLLLRIALIKINYRTKFNFTSYSLEEARSIAKRFIEFLAGLEANPDSSARDIEKLISKTEDAFKEAMDDDLNVSQALAVIFDFMEAVVKQRAKGVETFNNVSDSSMHVHPVVTLSSSLPIREARIDTLASSLPIREARIDTLASSLPIREARIVNFLFKVDEVLGFIKPLWEEYQTRLQEATSNPEVVTLLEERTKLRSEGKYQEADSLRRSLSSLGVIVSDTRAGSSLSLTTFP